MPIFRPRQMFYGWYIVGAGMLINMLMGGLIMHAFGFYAAALKSEFGWSATLFGVAFAVTRVESGLLGPIQGWMIDRFGPRAMIRLGVTSTALGLVLFGMLQDQATFIGFYLIVAVGTSIGGFMTVSVSVVTWFEQKRSRAVGFMSVGFTLGSLIAPIVGVVITGVGWREAAIGSGVFLFVVGQMLAFLFVRHPSDRGLEVDGAAAPSPSPAAKGAQRALAARTNPYRHRDFTAPEALRTRAFWGLALAHGAPLMVVGMVMGHLVLHVDEIPGLTTGHAGLALIVMAVAQGAGQLTSGYLGDMLPKRPMLILTMIGHCVAAIILGWATAFWMVLLFAVVNGVAWGARGTLITSLRADYFGASHFGRIMGWTSMVMSPFMIVGGLGGGIMRDLLGSYEIAFTVMGIGAGTGVLWILLATRPRLPGARTIASVSMEAARLVAHRRPNRAAAIGPAATLARRAES